VVIASAISSSRHNAGGAEIMPVVTNHTSLGPE
jgi:hypothetical protein